MEESLKYYCLREDLSTYDPYDIWKTSLGVKVKDWFNRNKYIAGGPALLMTLYDQFLNNSLRLGYKKQEYPIVRALAAQTLLYSYQQTKNQEYLHFAKTHLDWLAENSSKGYSGHCWGLGFKWAVYNGVIYDANTPHSTHTPYALEAFDLYTRITNDSRYVEVIKSCFNFYENDLVILSEDEESMGISYGPLKDRVVNNAVSYTILAYSIFLTYFPEKEDYIKNKIQKFFNFLKKHQLEDGAWFYAPLEANSFIDCFHSCIILKNLFKVRNMLDEKMDDWNAIIEKGYNYVLSNFYNENVGLFRRFSKTNKLSIVNFDLYDNAEVLALAKLLKDRDTIKKLEPKIKEVFSKNNQEIYSSKNIFGKLINKNTLRWAVMPYLYAQSLNG
ncbi:hypothetical protein [Cecembia lonarensis]|uniref:Uncharacterized protein n=1 Tax=Cecembia lonarensis (strain CCUG 58316 / KCTC 22772 / LW9) TaxID=1225176 RepID=K1M552_CECL9|nr:hypothetical protein [Cecembia lonarensis]EKB51329.1 hypothetical protein B879_00123 [Cecembia lonarensis LW9]